MRIASLVPSATDLVAALGLAEHLVGVSHECDHPAARGLPSLTRSRIPAAPASPPAEVDRAVRDTVQAGESLYVADRALLADLRPDLVLSQAICDVCAVEGQAAREALPAGARLLMVEATSLAGLETDVLRVAEAAGERERGAELVQRLMFALDELRGDGGPRMLTLEWGDPPFIGGHWVPELVELVGGTAALGRAGAPSRRATWPEAHASAPEVVVFLPCGYRLEEAAAEASRLEPLRAFERPEWATDAPRLFSRCTPDAVVEGARTLAAIARGESPAAAAARRVL
ncbi:MAG: cobalamin-binding protein [Sandaracinaceae bacterium]